jgi:hypothetical protein
MVPEAAGRPNGPIADAVDSAGAASLKGWRKNQERIKKQIIGARVIGR